MKPKDPIVGPARLLQPSLQPGMDRSLTRCWGAVEALSIHCHHSEILFMYTISSGSFVIIFNSYNVGAKSVLPFHPLGVHA